MSDAENIQRKKLFKGGNFSRKYDKYRFLGHEKGICNNNKVRSL